jgi:hypothetical protein
LACNTLPYKIAALREAHPDRRLEGFRDAIVATLSRQAVEGGKHFALLRCAKALGGVQEAAGWSDAEVIQWLMDALPDTVNDWKLAARTAKDGLARGRALPTMLPDREIWGAQA